MCRKRKQGNERRKGAGVTGGKNSSTFISQKRNIEITK
jgi:hypothetical protein